MFEKSVLRDDESIKEELKKHIQYKLRDIKMNSENISSHLKGESKRGDVLGMLDSINDDLRYLFTLMYIHYRREEDVEMTKMVEDKE